MKWFYVYRCELCDKRFCDEAPATNRSAAQSFLQASSDARRMHACEPVAARASSSAHGEQFGLAKLIGIRCESRDSER